MSKINWKCKDCRKDTHNEYYMVHDSLWKKAVPKDGSIMLCILCLEKRLGFKLCRFDFTLCPLNEWNYNGIGGVSKILRNRICASS